jgi:hypothetical protein
VARIRSIKPEFWSSPGIEELDPKWRLLFIAMWQWADDYGRGTAEPRELMGFAFPRDENMTVGEFRRGLGGIHRVFGVKFYHFSKRPYYAIPSWEKHQKIDKRAKASKYPDPDDGVEFDPENGQVIDHSPVSSMGSSEDSGGSAGLSGNSGAGTGEQGNRGTGEQRKDLAHPSVSERPSDRFDEFWSLVPRKVGKDKARTKFAAAVRRTGDAQVVIDGMRRFANDPNLPTDKQYIPHPATWLEAGRWEDEPLPSRLSTVDSRTDNSFAAWGGSRKAAEELGIDWDAPPTPNTVDGEVVDAEIVRELRA